MARAGRWVSATTATAAVVGAAGVAWRVGGPRIVSRTERRLCASPPAIDRSPSVRARELHRTLRIADLHSDALLWGRDLLVRGDRGHVDVPRLIEGGVALQALSASVRVPRHLNLDRNADTSDDVLFLAVASGWPPQTWRSPLARALHLAARARSMAERSEGRLTLVTSQADLAASLERRGTDRAMTAGLLTIEGLAPLEGEIDNLGRLVDAGYRLLGLAHFVDNAFAGSAHGLDKGGLTGAGRDLVRTAEERSLIVDLAHASAASVDDVLAVASRPVVVSHGGLRSAFDSVRNQPDEQVRGIAATGGLVGVGFWPAVTGGDDVASIARSIRRAVEVAGIEHVGLGSDWDGAVPVPIDPTGLVYLTDALLAEGFGDDEVRAVMGENVLTLLERTLPVA
jgi:microsomal dipeptidase-like Zn-dependent dipeptidase